MVFQDPLSFLNPIMRIGRQIAESIERHTPERPVGERVGELLELVRLPASLSRAYPHELSGGMRQRALLAVALACEPRLLIADEPTTALDVTTQAEILALLRDLREKLGMAMLLITHDLGIVASACERLYVIYAGRVVEWGRTKEVFAEPAHPYTVGLFHAARADRDAQGRFATIGGEPPDLGESAQGCPFAPRCPKALPECVRSMPDASVLGEGASHAVRCWLYPQAQDATAAADRAGGG
jgi:oligopeptide/dipeptide ABC transporter ATP-binding protein